MFKFNAGISNYLNDKSGVFGEWEFSFMYLGLLGLFLADILILLSIDAFLVKSPTNLSGDFLLWLCKAN